jgi:beta-lactam-binding protein with PASTA domain
VSPDRPDWVVVALAATLGLVLGLVVAVGLGSTRQPRTTTVTVSAKPPAGATLIAKTAVPAVVGQRLDIAKDRVRQAGFVTKVEGGGVLGVVRDRNWEVTSQDPAGGQVEQTGSTVRLRVERR